MVAKEICPSVTLINWSNSYISLSYLAHRASNLPPLHCHPLHPPLIISKVNTVLRYQAENKGASPSPPAICLVRRPQILLCMTTSKLANLSKPRFPQAQSRGADGNLWVCARTVRQEYGKEGRWWLVQRYNTLLWQTMWAVPLASSHHAGHSDRLVGSRRGLALYLCCLGPHHILQRPCYRQNPSEQDHLDYKAVTLQGA